MPNRVDFPSLFRAKPVGSRKRFLLALLTPPRTCWRAQVCLASCWACRKIGLSRTTSSVPSARCPGGHGTSLGNQLATPARCKGRRDHTHGIALRQRKRHMAYSKYSGSRNSGSKWISKEGPSTSNRQKISWAVMFVRTDWSIHAAEGRKSTTILLPW